MKTYISLIIGIFIMINPYVASAEIEGYEIVSENNKENITLYGKKTNGLYRGFKIDFKGGIYTRSFWNRIAQQVHHMPHTYSTKTLTKTKRKS
ncbi:hypothetical protein [Aquibacillus salsiterrae]|uniref:Uncharacterized protein n=1 Tax=Aquibacillus salsiterrae TaxID=2950439 RepID=A0A9X3WG20_9BACI|nr:hypothetical protein [Aquibacillus salsiterrae]MDC3417993.1 hypothetical protein [Aquibacillus salsiterrae]